MASLYDFVEYTAPFEGGFRPRVYPDSKSIPTVGFGFNLNRRDSRERLEAIGLRLDLVISGAQALTPAQGMRLMVDDLTPCVAVARKQFKEFDTYPERVQLVLVDVMYNMGISALFDNPGTEKVEGFPGFVRAIRARDWALAAGELLFRNIGKPERSGYSLDTKTRADHNASSLLAEAKRSRFS